MPRYLLSALILLASLLMYTRAVTAETAVPQNIPSHTVQKSAITAYYQALTNHDLQKYR